MTSPVWKHARGSVPLDRCLVMGIANRTPDSFYDGGRTELAGAVDHALRMVDEGADILDLGAVKAGPGEDVPSEVEEERLLPFVSAVAERAGVPISVETARPQIARRAIDSGAAIVNDVSALADPGLVEVAAQTGAGLVVMHNGGQIRGRPRHPRYDDVVIEVRDDLEDLAGRAEAGGVHRDQIVVDPGLDFGKTTYHSLELMRRLGELIDPGRPVLIAASRKDVVGETLGVPPQERLEGSLVLAALAACGGASCVRVHDVAASVAAVRMAEAVAGRRRPAAAIRGLWD